MKNKKYKPFLIDKRIDVDNLLTIFNEEYKITGKRDYKLLYRTFISESLFDTYTYHFEKHDNSYFLMFYGKSYFRIDHQKTFLDFANNFNYADVICAKRVEGKRKAHPLRFLKYQLLSFIWVIQLLFRGVKFKDSVAHLSLLITCKETEKFIKKIDFSKYFFVVSYYDMAPDQNYLIQFCNSKNIRTMTLQHGIFARKSNITIINDMAVEFTESPSNYYLAWNEYTKDEAMKVGIPENKIIVLGIPRYSCFEEPPTRQIEKKNCFGVMLNGKNFGLHNKKLIDMANKIYLISGIKFYLRYHPSLKGDEYASMCEGGYLGNLSNKDSIQDYISCVDFTIISSSSVFVDLIFLKHPVYRLIVSDDDTYSNVGEHSFSSEEELVDCITKVGNNDSNEVLFKYLCTGYNTIEKYRDFFNKTKNELSISREKGSK